MINKVWSARCNNKGRRNLKNICRSETFFSNQMKPIPWKFSSRARLICRESDPSQPIHFLFRDSRYKNQSRCIICRDIWGSSDGHHLRCDTCDYNIHRRCYFQTRCRMSDLTKPHFLERQYGKLSRCSACKDYGSVNDYFYYHCRTCKKKFHNVCHLYPPKIKHPFHSLHPLTLTFSSESSSHHSDLKHLPLPWQEEHSDSETEPDESDDVSISEVRCKCCQRRLQDVYYHCSICNYSINLTCTRNPPALTISYGKCHEHTLTLFPRRVHSPCDACGLSLDKTNDLVYNCLLCNYMVHWTCIYLPRVIKITRHPHRLSLSSSLPSGVFRCGVCRHNINVTYGQFSCVKGCHYAVHSRCAVEGRVWDGKDLDGVPEDPDEDDIDPFVRIDDETIDHFSHEHYLKLHKNDDVSDENRFCHACTTPVLVSESFYSCIQCNFLLHEACASLRGKIDHPLHKHSLILYEVPPVPFESEHMQRRIRGLFPTMISIEGMFKCSSCEQIGNGFMYKCRENGCEFQLDTRCASLPDPLIHGSHPHDLFFNLTQGDCLGCKSSSCSSYSLECMECKSFLGLKCASLPIVTYYKHDRHPLTLCYGEKDTTSSQHWCEICESKLDAKEWFYTCDDCSVTVHVSCLLGKQIFWKPASFEVTTPIKRNSFSVIRNNGNNRAFCVMCSSRCVEPFVFKFNNNVVVCTFSCVIGRILR